MAPALLYLLCTLKGINPCSRLRHIRFRAKRQWSYQSMVACVGPLATRSREPGQARKGAAAAVDSGAGVWLAQVASLINPKKGLWVGVQAPANR